MSDVNYAAVLKAACDLKIEKWPMPVLESDEVLLRMDCVGICGSDVKLYSTGKCGSDEVTEPLVIGHEGAGVVIKLGAKVSTLKVGDRVAIEPVRPCRTCSFCKEGKYNLCPLQQYCSSNGTNGNLATYYKHVADFCHKIPDNLSMEEAAAVQPLAISIHVCRRANIKLGDKVAILGGGPIGVLCAMTARAMGATTILITDVLESRLETVQKLGVAQALLTKKDEPETKIVERIILEMGAPPDITIDACAYASAQRTAMMVTRCGGTVVVVGIGEESVSVPLTSAMMREVDIKGSFRFANTYPAALAAVSSGAIDLKPFITHHFPLAQSRQAIELCRSGAGMKVIIHVQQ